MNLTITKTTIVLLLAVASASANVLSANEELGSRSHIVSANENSGSGGLRVARHLRKCRALCRLREKYRRSRLAACNTLIGVRSTCMMYGECDEPGWKKTIKWYREKCNGR